MSRLFDKGRKVDGKLKFPFTYRNSSQTDVRATIERVRREQAEREEKRLQNVRKIK